MNKKKIRQIMEFGIKRFFFRILVSIKYFRVQKEARGKILKYSSISERDITNRDYLRMDFTEVWKKSFLSYNKYKPREVNIMIDHLRDNNVYLVKKYYEQEIPRDEPILICNVKNDLERVKMLVEHHRKLGVKYFAFLDNMSVDGTFEWLQEQPFDLFRVEEQYSSVIRAMWITKIASFYNLNRWFITIDSDELLVYDRFETKKIQDVITCFKEKNLDRGMGFMIDMYARSSNLKDIDSHRDIYKTYNIFDTDGYIREKGILGTKIHGGPRERYFGEYALMTKYPLFYWRSGEINRYHYIFPGEDNQDERCYLGLLHYKFIDGDYEKIKKIVEDGNYARGSALYKTYLKGINEDGKISFCYKGSRNLNESRDLLEIEIFDSLWD